MVVHGHGVSMGSTQSCQCWGSSILSPTTIFFQWVICRVYLTIPLKGYVNLPYIRIIMRFRVSPVELCELVKCRYHHTSLVNKRVKVSMIGTHDNTILIDLYLRNMYPVAIAVPRCDCCTPLRLLYPVAIAVPRCNNCGLL